MAESAGVKCVDLLSVTSPDPADGWHLTILASDTLSKSLQVMLPSCSPIARTKFQTFWTDGFEFRTEFNEVLKLKHRRLHYFFILSIKKKTFQPEPLLGRVRFFRGNKNKNLSSNIWKRFERETSAPIFVIVHRPYIKNCPFPSVLP